MTGTACPADRRRHLCDGLALEVFPVDAAEAQRTAAAYLRWGKGSHPARLDVGDCFVHALADRLACPLLFVGEDFARTDAIPARPDPRPLDRDDGSG